MSLKENFQDAPQSGDSIQQPESDYYVWFYDSNNNEEDYKGVKTDGLLKDSLTRFTPPDDNEKDSTGTTTKYNTVQDIINYNKPTDTDLATYSVIKLNLNKLLVDLNIDKKPVGILLDKEIANNLKNDTDTKISDDDMKRNIYGLFIDPKSDPSKGCCYRNYEIPKSWDPYSMDWVYYSNKKSGYDSLMCENALPPESSILNCLNENHPTPEYSPPQPNNIGLQIVLISAPIILIIIAVMLGMKI